MRVKKAHLIVRMAAILIAFALGLIAVNDCANQIRVEQQKQVEQNLKDVAEQNVAQLELVMKSRDMILRALCSQMSGEEDPHSLVDQMAPLVDVYNVKRIGYINPEGESYTTDKYQTNMLFRGFFHRSLHGENCLTEVLVDELGAENRDTEYINVHSMPVYSENGSEITGVMFITYRTEDFNELLHVGSFSDQGTSCIIQDDGKVIAATKSSQLSTGENIFDILSQDTDATPEALDNLKRRMVRNGSALATFTDKGAERYFYVTQVESKPGWNLMTIVPTDVISQRIKPLLNNVEKMLFSVFMLLLFCVLVYLWTNHEQNKELFRVAYEDPLTKTDNYVAFRKKMRGGEGVSGAGYVVSVDLRSFGTINNTCGVPKGDELLTAMGKILTENLKHGELAAHVSGDQFVMFLHSDSLEALIERITNLRESIANLSPLLDVPHVVPAFGIRAVETPGEPEKSFSDANLAKQKAKDLAGDFYSVFDEDTRSKAVEIQRMEDNFEPALEERQFEMWYQPKYSPHSEKLVAAEALVRWRNPDGSLIPPGKFIPLFERNGMIAQLDEYTFDAVCRQQRIWEDEGRTLVPVSVNVSRASLYFSDIVIRYMVIVKKYGLSTDCIELEITESAMEGNQNIEELIQQFRSCGFRILVDDFGSGYSSLSTLTKKYFDNIKLDKSLTDCIGVPEGDLLLESTVHLAHEFNMTVTAEGVEDAKQVEFLRGLACDNIQGYYYSRPLPVDQFTPLLLPS